ncbi:MAG: betaine-aldehyde dehydrogenase [Actinobacteria bacterium]|nr:MAG: betaine-aldehyde dehydrogenase [Actinomycetota bacterium]
MTLLRHFINGKWQESTSRRVREIRSPHDQHVVAAATEGNLADVLTAIEAAHTTFESGIFRSWSWEDRQSLLLRIADLIERDADIYAKAESGDTAKRLIEAEYDIADVISVFRFNATLKEPGHSVDVGRPEIESRIAYEPVGVCALIGPWNYPLLQISWKVAPALLAGCSFIVKPSELSPSTAVLLMHTLSEAGVPAGVANLILGAGSEVGTPLTSDPRVDLISFTGGLATGRAIMASAASTVKKVALELGGKNPNIIFADADIDAAIDNAVTAGFLHSGQVCSAGTRLLVEASIHDRVVDELVRRAGEITLGGPDNEAAETGPLISEGQFNKVRRYLERAVAEGAVLRIGGKRASAPDLHEGWYFEPTVLDGCSTEMACVQKESFGPIITVETFTTEEEAIALGNDTIYGLSGAVWSADRAKCDRVAAALRHGTIWINDYGPYRPEAEWGGFKASGVGRELGESGVHEYLEAKHLWRNTSPGRSGWFRDSGHP